MNNSNDAQETEKRIAVLKSEMENIRQEYIKQSGVRLREWYKEISDKEMETRGKVTASLENDKLTQLKQEINDLIEHANQIATEFVGDAETWWHLNNESDLYFISFSHTPPNLLIPAHIDRQLRL